LAAKSSISSLSAVATTADATNPRSRIATGLTLATLATRPAGASFAAILAARIELDQSRTINATDIEPDDASSLTVSASRSDATSSAVAAGAAGIAVPCLTETLSARSGTALTSGVRGRGGESTDRDISFHPDSVGGEYEIPPIENISTVL
jgi:hypothetical protein